jgi:septum formation protein
VKKNELSPEAMAQKRSQLWLGPRLVLASGSASRKTILQSVGLPFDVDPAMIDERDVEEKFLSRGGAARDLAACLAEAKAIEVSLRNRDALCLGADQTLTLGDDLLHKPKTMVDAASHLSRLGGRMHRLVSAFCFAQNGVALFASSDVAYLTMRALDERAIALYLALVGEAALASVGAYQVEGLGAHLIEKIEGDHTTIVGLPLRLVLTWLRSEGCLAL